MLWTQGIHTDREVTANWLHTIIKKIETIHTDKCGNTSRQKSHVKGSSQ